MTSPHSIVILFASGLLAGAAARAHADEPQADPDDDEPTGRSCPAPADSLLDPGEFL